MRELTEEEVMQVSGGLAWIPLLLICGAVFSKGCSHTQPLRRGERPTEEAQ